MKRFAGMALIVAASIAMCTAAAHAGCREAAVVEVLDGATLQVAPPASPAPITLYGIDPPAPGHPAALESAAYLRELVSGGTVTYCIKQQAVRPVAEVFALRGYMLNVNRAMVRAGLARATAAAYMSHEKLARRQRLGLWSADPVVPQAPAQESSAREDSAEMEPASGGLSVYKVRPAPDRGGTGTPQEPGNDDSRRRELEALRGERRQRSQAGDEPGLLDIDQASIAASFYHGGFDGDALVDVSIAYSSSRLGRRVYWSGDDVNCDCSVTGHFSDGTSTRIARKDAVLRSHSDTVPISLPGRYLERDSFILLNRCTVECDISAGIFSLKASDSFRVYYPGVPGFIY